MNARKIIGLFALALALVVLVFRIIDPMVWGTPQDWKTYLSDTFLVIIFTGLGVWLRYGVYMGNVIATVIAPKYEQHIADGFPATRPEYKKKARALR